jgi:hypothetical protein
VKWAECVVAWLFRQQPAMCSFAARAWVHLNLRSKWLVSTVTGLEIRFGLLPIVGQE